MIKQYLITVLTTVTILPAFGQLPGKDRLDHFFDSLELNNKAMGSIAISKNGSLLYSKAIGFSLYGNNEKMRVNEETKYRIGSISKMYTAAMIFQLLEESKLGINEHLDKFFPEIPNADNITIANLLNHQSGIPHVTKMKDREKPHTHEEMLEFIAGKGSEFFPGSRSVYSNSNYLLLGYIIEKISGQTYAEVLNERIIKKIGLRNTYYGHSISSSENECHAYRLHGKWKQQPETDLSIPGGSGAIVSTPDDMVLFIEALFNCKLVNAASLEKMRTLSGDLGMGMVQFEYGNKKAYGHPGGIDRFESVLAYFPADSIAIAYCSNGSVTPVKDVVVGTLDIYFNKPLIAAADKRKSVSSNAIQQYVGVYSNPHFPLRITISRKKEKLVAKADDKNVYVLEPVASGKFSCEALSVLLEFDTAKDKLTLKRGADTYKLVREQ